MKRGHKRLDSVRSCRQFLANATNACRNGSMPPDTLRSLTYAVRAIVDILRDSDLEARIVALEENLKSGTNPSRTRVKK